MKEFDKKTKSIIVIILIILMLITLINIGGKGIRIANQNNKQQIKGLGYNDPYIPGGFTHIDGTTVENGFVIQEIETGNEFVWVPVDGTNVKLETKDFTVSDLKKNNVTETQNILFQESVNLYGGFYIARYEAGIPEGTTYTEGEKNVSGKPVSKKSQEVWNYINYENAETSANQMYATSTEMTSSLMSGQAWDTTLTWLEQHGYNVQNDSHSWGNYSNNPDTQGKVAKTGYENWVANNIYDLAGNVSEWTTERNSNNGIKRGGNYSNEGQASPAGMREKMSKTQYNNTTGFRVMLYKTGQLTIEGYDTPYMPSGFEYVEGTWDKGYVIRDTKNGNEFVWIPVDGRDIKIERNNFGTSFVSKDKAVDRLDLKFKISVNQNGGFYIARYESGQGTSSTGETLQGNKVGKPVSKKGVEVWTNISQEQAIKNSNLMYSSHPDMQSTLLSSYALDMTLQWLKNNGTNVESDSTNWGNYSTTSEKATKALTGSKEAYKVNNIYDLAGNVWELTTEKYNNGTDIIARGGDYLSTGSALPAASRDIAKSADAYDYMGYRTILYKTTKVEGVEVPEEWDSSKVSAIEDEDGNIIPIPKEFYYVKGTKNTGVVISDNKEDEKQSDLEDSELKGNQFVWVPVDNINYFTRREFGNSPPYYDEESVPEELTASVARYKGFYIGRYEASYVSGTKAEDYMPACKVSKGTNQSYTRDNLWRNITSANAHAASVNMYKDFTSVRGTLPYSAQWDTMLQWFIDSREKEINEVVTNSANWGNYYSSQVTGNDGTILKAANSSKIIDTGITEYTISNNIYDVAGNLGEVTKETYGIRDVARGGCHTISGEKASAKHIVNGSVFKQEYCGFRPSLYIPIDTNETTITSDITTPRNTTFTGDNNGVPAGPITVTLAYGESDLINQDKYQYKVGTDGEWQVSEDRVKILSITENCTIYTRYYTEGAGFETKSYTVANVDNDPPVEFEINAKNATEIGLVVQAETADVLSEISYYEYHINDVKYRVSKEDYKQNYIITKVKPGTKYTISVDAFDEAGNKKSSTTKEITTWTPTTYKWNATKHVNEPELTEGMIPVKWNGENWVTTTAEDEEWYDYKESGTNNESKWANVMLSDGTYKYDTVEAGTVVQEEELGSMFVWLPRYAYKIESGYHSSTAGEISIEFLEGTSSHKTGINIGSYPEYSYSETASESKMLNYVVHPAFNYDETQLTGLWIAKFVASREDATNSNTGSSEKIKIMSNKYFCLTQPEKAYKISIGMNDEGNNYKLNSKDNIVDPHLMKNTEWGAIAYLTYSKYGTNKTQVQNSVTNFNDRYFTGYQYVSNQNSASTKNIYGIYDLNAYDTEYVAAYVNNGKETLTTYASELLAAPNKHKDIYRVGRKGDTILGEISDTQGDNYEQNKDKYGDAIYEVSKKYTYLDAWLSQRIAMANGEYEVIVRGKRYIWWW